jgi:hypothetical protein
LDSPFLGINSSSAAHYISMPRQGKGHDDQTRHGNATNDSHERQCRHSLLPAVIILERDLIGFEADIQKPIKKPKTQRDQEKNGLLEKHLKWSKEIARRNISRTKNALLRLGMESPILGVSALALGALRERSPLESLRNVNAQMAVIYSVQPYPMKRVMKLPLIGPAPRPTTVLAAKMEMAISRSTGPNMSAKITEIYPGPR